MIKNAKLKTVGTVERERERESYTLNKKSAVLLGNAINTDNLINIKINNKEDGSIVPYIDTGQYCCLLCV